MRIQKTYKNLKMLLFGAFFSLVMQSHAQQNNRTLVLDDQLIALSTKYDLPALEKLLFFEKKNQWDSILIYTNRLSINEKAKGVKDYIHFFRGMALLRKRIEKPALKQFDLIAKSFPYYFKVEALKGEIYFESEQFEKALKAFLVVDTGSLFQSKHLNINAIVQNIGNCYFYLKQFDKAESYYLAAERFLNKNKNPEGEIHFYLDMANLYYEQYIDDKAIFYFEKAYNLAKEKGDFFTKQITAQNMAVIEENRKNFQKSVEYHKEYEQWHDSVTDQNKIYAVAQQEKKFAVDQKQRQVKLLQTENKLKQTERNLYLIASLALGIILAFGVYFFRQNLKRSKIILLQKQELDELNTMKDRLFSIVSHDLRSSVYALKNSNASLYDHITSGRFSEVENQLERNTSIATNTYNLLDNLLHWALLQTKGGYFKQENHRIGMLIEQVVYNFQSLLNEKQISFENQLPKKVKTYIDAESMKIVFRNFMDNSIKFSDSGAKIIVSFLDETDDTIRISWKDTGKGMSEETRLKLLSETEQLTKKEHEKEIGSGLGMNLCKSMIQKNGGSLDIRSELGKGTEFIITLQKSSLDGAAN